MKYNILFFISFITCLGFSQNKKIKILNSEQTYKDEARYPRAVILNGAVKISHDGAIMTCNKALLYSSQNLLHAYGEVKVNQGDTIKQSSDYMNYNGNTKKAISWGNVVLTDPSIKIETDTLHFDRELQEMYYNCNAKITDVNNKLTSKNGTYYTEQKKFTATTNVVVSNPENKLVSGHLDYYTESGQTYFYGPSTITTKESVAYGERGFYDTKIGISRLMKNAKINYDNRIIEGDSIFSNKEKGFASSTGNTIVTDTINNMIIKGGYAEFHRLKDSVLVLKRPVAISIVEKDSTFIHGDTLLITGKPEDRIVRAYHHVKIFKSDLQGKCDSLHTKQSIGLTKMFKNPILWSGENQITGDSIHLLSNSKTNQLDSLFIKTNAFIIQKDSVGYNQIKGKNMYGKFVDNKLKTLLAKGNGQVVNYARDEMKKLIAIMKMSCSNILFELDENAVKNIKFLNMPDGKTYPPSQFPVTEEKLKGFIWRANEKPLTKEDIFIHDDEVSSQDLKKKVSNIQQNN
ncbi:OstA-like protein [Flavicella sediminum]|uniref:OstA-like protein n=1 Tax=Flavicella sediminum TaxID=2585141 RepID=UPI001FB6BECF|nr:OstA-like protein [Flavicella sediminum]